MDLGAGEIEKLYAEMCRSNPSREDCRELLRKHALNTTSSYVSD